MLDIPIQIPWWLVLIFLAICAVFLYLSGVGIYYLVSKQFNKLALIVSALIFLTMTFPKSFNPLNPYHWSEFIKIYSELIMSIKLVLTFFAIFGVVNFVYRLLAKTILKQP